MTTVARRERRYVRGPVRLAEGRAPGLPGAVEDDVKASYHDGILEVSVPVAEAKKAEPKRISVVKE